MLTAMQIKPDVYWVGGIDWNARSFHGYTTADGITYNAYLILDEKITLVDTTKATFAEELIGRISSIVDPAKIDVIIANHIEMDHSGSIPAILELAPHAEVYASAPAGVKELAAHFGIADERVHGVKTGDTLEIGKRTLSFVQTAMVHWPDNMVTYSAYDKILFSNDAFGQHFASGARFEDENDLHEIMLQACKYYANIVQPYGKQADAALSAVKGLGIENIDVI
ncbi:MAG TPA: FprA family A-type flavoprotein, partial [Atopobiaceae bacterium]|nr:FprA family A-type flavoprotein [Atopobiaceae bacterium]